jgi:xylan 1,4-beta-xylosidase
MPLVLNPILPGFHPDPCILRVNSDYYIATSTFEWWPGVRIHHSRDLINWRLIGSAITRHAQLDLRGAPPSGGVWAPALSYADGLFWLVYSDVKAFNGCSKDVRNYLITAPDIEGPWSDPVSLNSSGFDPSLFHDQDGRKWILNQIWDGRPDRNQFAGIALQEYCPASRQLIGRPTNIFGGSSLGVTEGPHLLQRDGFYYLIVAEGGTGDAHAVTVARSRTLTGPYEVGPENPILTSAGHPEAPLQKAGHASFVQTPEGGWYLVHLCSRPIGPKRRCILGRETALQSLDWPAGKWPKLACGGRLPSISVELPGPTALPYLPRFSDDFSSATLHPQWSFLREPPDPTWLSLTERTGTLRLRGRQSLLSCFDQSLVGFRLLHPRCRVSVQLDFAPHSFQQTAGLAFYYNPTHFHYLCLTARDGGGRELRLLCGDNGSYTNPAGSGVRVPDSGPVVLTAELEGETLRYFYMPEAGPATPVGPALDASILSDDYVIEGGSWGFTGCFITLSAQDSGDTGIPADFSGFHYEGLPLADANPTRETEPTNDRAEVSTTNSRASDGNKKTIEPAAVS